MSLYETHVTKAFRLPPTYDMPPLTTDAITSALQGATVSSITPSADGYDVAVHLERGDHGTAMDELTAAFQHLGFATVQAAITEFVGSWLEGAAVGAAGGAALGAATKSAEGFLLLFLGGLAVGALTGSAHQTIKARYSAHRLHPGPGGWQITRQDKPAGEASQPAF
jgi:hypothetical protein